MVHDQATRKGLEAKREREGKAGHPDLPAPTHPDAELKPSFGLRVSKWFDDRKITENGTLSGQFEKLQEEVSELDTALDENDRSFIEDAIGDCAVVLAGIAHMKGMSFEQCCEIAWNEIKDRTGHVNEEGIFVKD